jgi:hypothetical protein
VRSVLRAVLVLRLPRLQPAQVLEDRVRSLETLAIFRDEERDLVLALAVLLPRCYLFRGEVDTELRQPFAHGGRVRAPLGLVERQHERMLDRVGAA